MTYRPSLINSELAEYAGLLESELYRIVDELKKKGAEKINTFRVLR